MYQYNRVGKKNKNQRQSGVISRKCTMERIVRMKFMCLLNIDNMCEWNGVDMDIHHQHKVKTKMLWDAHRYLIVSFLVGILKMIVPKFVFFFILYIICSKTAKLHAYAPIKGLKQQEKQIIEIISITCYPIKTMDISNPLTISTKNLNRRFIFESIHIRCSLLKDKKKQNV